MRCWGEEYDVLSVEYRQATDRIQKIDEEFLSREARKRLIELFLRRFEKQESDVTFDPGPFMAMVERILVRAGEGNKCKEWLFE